MTMVLQVSVTIVDDNQWEPDEEFFLKLALLPKVKHHIISYHIIYRSHSFVSYHFISFIISGHIISDII